MSRLPVVVVVGRPNVGKSTLVNRIVGGRPAVVEEMPGVTRDRREFVAEWAGRSFMLVDTGGWELAPGEPIVAEIRRQAEAAVATADAILFVVDANTGLLEDDAGVVKILRSAGPPVLLVANKVDDASHESLTDALWGLGLDRPYPVSAFHGRGTGDLLDALVSLLPDERVQSTESDLPRLAIVGRPNVGKSTLLNRLLGEDRVIVSDRPGTTRDPIDAVVELDGVRYRIIDTAGIRRRPQITEDADVYAVLRAREVLGECDAALLVIDSLDGVTHQDQRIAAEAVAAGAAIVVILNKWDMVDDETRPAVEADVGDRLGFISWAPVLRMSARTGARVGRLAAAVEHVIETRAVRLTTGELNRHLAGWTAAHPPPVRKGRRPRLQYMVQAGTEPPTFVVFVTGGELGEDYLRYLENQIRRLVDLTGTPIHFVTRGRKK